MQSLSERRVFSDEAYNARGALRKSVYRRELRRLQVELVKMQRAIAAEGRRVVVLFEGRDAAGKGGVIKRISERTSPRIVRTVALGVPSDRERRQWYFQRYVAELPAAGEMVLFDRSWYNRANVERVMGFATAEEVAIFMQSCPQFEDMLQREGIQLIKYWFSVSEQEQERRLQARVSDPIKRWKLSPIDVAARTRWQDYSQAKDEMMAQTDRPESPWRCVDAEIKRHARLNCIADLLGRIPYPDEPLATPDLPPRHWTGDEDGRAAKPIESYIDRLY